MSKVNALILYSYMVICIMLSHTKDKYLPVYNAKHSNSTGSIDSSSIGMGITGMLYIVLPSILRIVVYVAYMVISVGVFFYFPP